MDNVAEGFDAGTNPEFIRFLRYAKRSCTELQSQLYRVLDRGYCDQDRFKQLYDLAHLAKSKIGGCVACLKKNKAGNPEPCALNPKPKT